MIQFRPASFLRHVLVLLSLGLPAISRGQPVAWNLMSPPSPRYGHRAIYDPVRDRMVIYGGSMWSRGGGPFPSSEAWALDFATLHWTRLAGGAGSGYWYHTAVYDAPRDRMVIFGGRENEGGPLQNEGLVVQLATGTLIAANSVGSVPAPTAHHLAVVDAARQRMIEFGGESAQPLTTINRLDLVGNSWSSVAAAGIAPPVFGPADTMTGVADPIRDRMLVLKVGVGVYQLTFSDPPTWAFLSPGGTPPPTLDGAPVYDPVRDRVLLLLNDASVWALSLAPLAWSRLTTTGTLPAGGGATSMYDSARDRLVVTGGVAGNDTYALDLATNAWSLVLSPGTIPPRWDLSPIVAPTLDAMLLFGGGGGPGNDLLVYPLDAQHRFSTLATSGPTPPARSQNASCYDSGHNRMLVFGGQNTLGNLGDVHALTLSGAPTWAPIVAPGGPGLRTYPNASYDPVRDRLLIFGGETSGHYYTDVWALTLSGAPTWTQLIADGAIPELESGSSSFYDGRRDRLVVVGPPLVSPKVTAWALNLSGTPAWTQIAAPGAGPGDLRWWGAALDSLGDRILFYGGLLNNAPLSSGALYSLQIGSPTLWTVHNLPGPRPLPRVWGAMVHDKNRFRSVLIGGKEDDLGNVFRSYATADIWTIQQDASTPVLASVVFADAVNGVAHIQWQVSDDPDVGWSVERADPGAWRTVGMPQVTGPRRLEFRDADVRPGASYGYRLMAIGSGGDPQRLGEVWVTVPALELGLTRLALDPDRWLRFEARVPTAGPAIVEAFDAAGRRLGRTRLEPGAPGTVSGALPVTGGRAGLYLVRLTQGTRSVTRRLAARR